MKCSEIRDKFVGYYQNFGFKFIPQESMLQSRSSMSFVISCSPPDMNQPLTQSNKFLKIQDCFRHFDMDSVGKTNLHLSLFEMPGAFTLGANRQESTISRMWEMATNVMGIDPNRIWVSYFGGGHFKNMVLPEDRLTHKAWQKIGISEDKLVGLGIEHNYWIEPNENQNRKEPLRKCGSNTELFYDLGKEKSCGIDCKPGCRCGRFVEFSNCRFVSYSLNTETAAFVPTEIPRTETVIGTERIAMILQNAESVFDLQSYSRLIETIHKFTANNNFPLHIITESERIIADHLKALYVLVSQGAPAPGRSGRARIIRTLIRRILSRQIILGIKSKDFILRLVPLTLKAFNNRFQPTLETQEKIKTYLESESQRFYKTLERGQIELKKLLEENKGQPLSESQLLYLEKKQGLPRILTQLIVCKDKNAC